MIAAHAKHRVIGLDNKLPWHLPGDLKFFKEQTLKYQNVLFGKNTYYSLSGRSLPGRNIFVLSRTMVSSPGVSVFKEVSEVVDFSRTQKLIVAGGQKVYESFMPMATELLITEINTELKGDSFFPAYKHEFYKESVISTCYEYEISRWLRK